MSATVCDKTTQYLHIFISVLMLIKFSVSIAVSTHQKMWTSQWNSGVRGWTNAFIWMRAWINVNVKVLSHLPLPSPVKRWNVTREIHTETKVTMQINRRHKRAGNIFYMRRSTTVKVLCLLPLPSCVACYRRALKPPVGQCARSYTLFMDKICVGQKLNVRTSTKNTV